MNQRSNRPSHDPQALRGLVDRLCLDQRRRWLQGERVSAESLLRKHPEIRQSDEAVFDLIYQEYVLRSEMAGEAATTELCRRFPDFADRLRRQIELHRALESSGRRPDASERSTRTFDGESASGGFLGFPSVAPFPPTDRFEPLECLGSGGMGVVYSAWDHQWQQKVAVKLLHRTADGADERLRQNSGSWPTWSTRTSRSCMSSSLPRAGTSSRWN